MEPYLQHEMEAVQSRIIAAFAERVRSGACSKGHKVRAQMVSVALRAIGATCELDGRPNPLYRAEGRYLRPLERQLEAFKREDPPPQHKLAVPVTVVEHLAKVADVANTSRDCAISDLTCIAFYYLLRVGEYTFHSDKQKRRTRQFRARDVTFFDSRGIIIPNNSPLSLLLQAKDATLHISNQKNGTRGSLVNNEANDKRSCPVRALARRVHHIMSFGGPDDILGTYFTDHRRYKSHIVEKNINDALKRTVVALNLVASGFPPDAISSHSLRAGGAMAMHLNGVSPVTIRKQGRWSSDTFLMYIHEQISAFSKGVSRAMGTEIGWRNIAGPTLLNDPEEEHAPAA